MTLGAVPFWMHEWQNHTTVHPVGLAMLLLAGVAMLILPRRWAVLPVLVMACFVAPAQRIVVAGLDFNFIRCMVLFGWARLLVRGEARSLKWLPMDTAILVWGLVSTIFYTLQVGDFGAFVYRLGTSYDAVGLYFLFRFLIRSWEDITKTLVAIALISIPVMMFFIVERLTRHNLFSVFGGVPTITIIREGRMRCQGAFAHSILAGCFWAALIPMLAALLWQGVTRKFFAFVGVFNCLGLIFLCASSTPLVAAMAGGAAWLLFPIRYKMRQVRWAIVLLLFSLHMVMHKPVWHLLARIDLVGGSTGWHRYKLVDLAINNWSEWFVTGLHNTAHWGMVDITNEYVLQGLRGGIVTLAVFVAIITMAFISVGKMIRVERGNTARLMLAWGMGVGLFIHVSSFVSVSYFGQIQMLWYLHLAMIGSAMAVTQQKIDLQKQRKIMEIVRARRERARKAKAALESAQAESQADPVPGDSYAR